jgi:hypothetical protein
MKTRLCRMAILPLFICLCGCLTVAKERSYSVRIVDDNSPDSPLKASGQVVFHEEPSVGDPNTLNSRTEYDVAFTNVSSKDIRAYEVVIESMTEHGMGQRHTDRGDFFFQHQSMFPIGSQQVLQFVMPPAPGWSVTQYDPSAQPSAAKAAFSVSFVEFADGSTYGSSKWGGALPEARRATVARLQDLQQAFKNGGETALKNTLDAALVRKDNPSPTKDQLEHLEVFFNEGGSAALTAKIEEFLIAAKEHGLTSAN